MGGFPVDRERARWKAVSCTYLLGRDEKHFCKRVPRVLFYEVIPCLSAVHFILSDRFRQFCLQNVAEC
jgi:hypothetical protein